MNLSIKKTCTDQLSTRKKRRTKLVLMLWGTDQEVLGGGTIQATELLNLWERTWVVGRFVDVTMQGMPNRGHRRC